MDGAEIADVEDTFRASAVALGRWSTGWSATGWAPGSPFTPVAGTAGREATTSAYARHPMENDVTSAAYAIRTSCI